MLDLEKDFVDAIKSPATIRCLHTGVELFSNSEYKKLITIHKEDCCNSTLEEIDNVELDRLIESSGDVLLKANFTFCKHLDNIFINKEMQTLLAEETLNNQHFVSLRTKVNYHNSDAMLIIFGERKNNFNDCTSHANFIHC